jgi:hypothetical protein
MGGAGGSLHIVIQMLRIGQSSAAHFMGGMPGCSRRES